MKTFNAVILLKFLQFWGLEYTSNPHPIMWGLQLPNHPGVMPLALSRFKRVNFHNTEMKDEVLLRQISDTDRAGTS